MTILYSAKKCLGYAVVFKGNGSVLFQPRTLFSACVSGFVAAICSFHRAKQFVADGVGNPEIFFSAVGFVLGFAEIMSQYNTGRTLSQSTRSGMIIS